MSFDASEQPGSKSHRARIAVVRIIELRHAVQLGVVRKYGVVRGTGRPTIIRVEVNPVETDPTNWAKEISLGDIGGSADDSIRASLPPDVFQAGNLSALEDEPHSQPSPSGSRGSTPSPMPMQHRVAPSGPQLGGQMMSSNPPPPYVPMPLQHSTPVAPSRRGAAGAAVGVVVVLFAAAAFAAAWFTHLIPH